MDNKGALASTKFCFQLTGIDESAALPKPLSQTSLVDPSVDPYAAMDQENAANGQQISEGDNRQ
jgi:hypothetical protein